MSRPSRPFLLVLVIAAVAVGAPIAWYLGSPLFLRTELHEPAIVAFETPDVSAVPAAMPPATPTLAEEPSEATVPSPASVASPTAPAWTPAPSRTGRFAGTDDFHFGRGTATLREVEPGRWVVRLEDFAVRNGPDLYLVLSPDPAGYTTGAIEVGRLKATDGSFNMRVADETDVSGVRSVLIWCKQFSHLFAVAPLEG